MYPKIESLELELHKCLHSEQNEQLSLLIDGDSFVRKLLSRVDFDDQQIDFLVELRHKTKGFDLEMFVAYLHENSSEVISVLPGFVSVLDTESWNKISNDTQLKDLVKGKRVVLVGPSQHMQGSKSEKLIESYDVVARLNTQWPVPMHLREDLGTRMDLLFHCCNGDTSINYLDNQDLKQTKLICYELGLSAFKLDGIAKQHKVPTLNVSPTYWHLANLLGTPPNTGVVAISKLLDTDLEELFIAGLTFMQDPYYENYHADGNVNSLWKNGEIPDKVGPHDIASQYKYARTLFKSDKRVKADWRLQQLLNSD